MGFIRAALSSGLNSFNDSKFKEAIVLPNNLTADALAIKGQLLTKILTALLDKATKILDFNRWFCSHCSTRLCSYSCQQRNLPWRCLRSW